MQFILSEGNFLNICVLHQCTVYEYILLRIKKYYLIHFCCLILKSWKVFSVSISAVISDHFSIIYAFKLKTKLDIPKTLFLHKRIIKEDLIKAFKSRLHEILLEIIKSIKDRNESYKKFVAIFTSIYDEFFS